MLPPIKQLLEKPMDRKEFLQHIGVGILMMAGVGVLLQTVQRQLTSQQNVSRSVGGGYGYGSNVYGGRRKF